MYEVYAYLSGVIIGIFVGYQIKNCGIKYLWRGGF